MTARTIRTWFLIHKWTSLVCTAFMLLLCVTGLPLIFHDEIDYLVEGDGALPPLPPRHAGEDARRRGGDRARRLSR